MNCVKWLLLDNMDHERPSNVMIMVIVAKRSLRLLHLLPFLWLVPYPVAPSLSSPGVCVCVCECVCVCVCMCECVCVCGNIP